MRPPSEVPSIKLSNREQQVLTLIAEGHTNDEIAATLHVSLSTVKTHVRGIFNKLGVNHRIQAVMVAFEKGLV
jgi:DNA-binding NarL/FixJ family response regulator